MASMRSSAAGWLVTARRLPGDRGPGDQSDRILHTPKIEVMEAHLPSRIEFVATALSERDRRTDRGQGCDSGQTGA